MSAQREVTGAGAAGAPLGFVERYLTPWVFLCIGAGIALGHLFPLAFRAIGAVELARINLPVAALVWLMIVPMLLKVDFASLHRVRAHWRTHGRGERLLMSFHGIPQRCADRGDPYPNDCETTARLLAETLQLAPRDWLQAYQSRFGRQQWLLPDTESVLAQWARSGVGSVDVICPAFATDCLETLEEIAEQNAERFCAQGGRVLRLIPCLNDSREHARALHALIDKNL